MINHFQQVIGTGDIARCQPGRIVEAGVFHANGARFLIHFRHEGFAPPGIVATQRRSGAIFRRHQRDMQHVTAAEGRADRQARVGFLQQITVGGGDHHPVAQRTLAVQRDHGSHQFG
ncbi:hypothetical protein D3C73_1043850 [compost metagenome]